MKNLTFNIILRYFTTIPIISLSIVFFITLFAIAYPYILIFIFKFRDDYEFWSLFGNWGILIISTILTLIFLIPLYSILAATVHKKICKISPNQNLAKYTSIICSIIYFTFRTYVNWQYVDNTLFSICNAMIGLIFILIILIFMNIDFES